MRTVTLGRVHNSRSEIEALLYTTLELVQNGLEQGTPLQLVIPTPQAVSTRHRPKKAHTTHCVCACFPSFNAQENLRFVRYVAVLQLLHDNVCRTQHTHTTTKRQLYYSNVALFGNQAIVDAYVDNVASCLGVSIESLGVVASQKGLVFGDLHYSYRGRPFNLEESQGPVLIPLISLDAKDDDIAFDTSVLKEIVVVEKEAVFKSMCEQLRATHTLLITAKGYADRLTKTFLRLVAVHHPLVPITCYVDSDIYGLMIFCNYRQELPKLVYGGVLLFEDEIRDKPDSEASGKIGHVPTAPLYLPITRRDFRLGTRFLERVTITQPHETDPEIAKVVREVQLGLFFGVKKEMRERF